MHESDSHFPGGYPMGPPELTVDTPPDLVTTSVIKKEGIGARIALAATAVALIAAGGFAARAALAPPSGPANSDEAIIQLFEALDNDDLIGLAELVHPAERESIALPMLDMIEHARRLEIVELEGTDPSAVTFTDTKVEGLTYTVEQTGPRLHYVTTTGGTITTPNDSSLPAGALFDRFDIDMPEGGSGTTTVDLADDPLKIAVVEDNGSWYVSLWYSLAEDIRRTEQSPFSELGTGPAPVGAASPDAVMEDMARALSNLDPEGVLTLLDPREAAVLYDYSSMYMNELEGTMEEIRAEADAEGIAWTLDSVDFDANELNGRQVVSWSQIAVTVSFELDGQSETASVVLEDGCTIVTFDSETQNSCAPVDDASTAEAARVLDEISDVLDLSKATMNAFEKLANVDVGLTVVEREGRWYLSLAPTALETVNDHLAVLEPEDLVAIGTDIEEIVQDGERIMDEILDLYQNIDLDSFESNEAGAVALGGLMESFGRESDATFEDVSRDIGGDEFTEPPGEEVGAFQIEVGDCFLDPDFEAEEFESVVALPCAQLHDNEVYAAFDIPGDEFPGLAEVIEKADQGCFDRFEPFVGIAYEDSVFGFWPIYPSAESWDQLDDREVICAIYNYDATQKTGTAQDSGR